MQSYTNISDAFLNFDLKSFLNKHSDDDPVKLALSYKPRHDFDTALLFDQIVLHKKAQKKLPSFAKHYCFFTRKSLEQASSEELAGYKSGLFSGKLLLDLSGGLGVDDVAFASSFRQVISVDKDEELNKLVRKNFDLLGIPNISRVDGDADTYLSLTNVKADLVYIDADRRTTHKKAVHLFDGEPDIPNLLSMLKPCTDQVLLKLSPLIDISHIQKHLSHIREIHVVSLRNEVKEVLVWIDWQYSGEMVVTAADINPAGEQRIYTPRQTQLPVYGQDGSFFFEPALCLIKANLASAYGAEKKLKQVGPQSLFFVTDQLNESLFGRCFEIKTRLDFSKAAVKVYLKDQKMGKANISRRNFPAEVSEIYTLLDIKEGGADYLFFTTDSRGNKLMYHCIKPGLL